MNRGATGEMRELGRGGKSAVERCESVEQDAASLPDSNRETVRRRCGEAILGWAVAFTFGARRGIWPGSGAPVGAPPGLREDLSARPNGAQGLGWRVWVRRAERG